MTQKLRCDIITYMNGVMDLVMRKIDKAIKQTGEYKSNLLKKLKTKILIFMIGYILLFLVFSLSIERKINLLVFLIPLYIISIPIAFQLLIFIINISNYSKCFIINDNFIISRNFFGKEIIINDIDIDFITRKDYFCQNTSRIKIFLKDKTLHKINFELFSYDDFYKILTFFLEFNYTKNKILENKVNKKSKYRSKYNNVKYSYTSKEFMISKFLFFTVLIALIYLITIRLILVKLYLIFFLTLFLLFFSQAKIIISITEKKIILKNIIGITIKIIYIDNVNQIIVLNNKKISLEFIKNSGKPQVINIGDYKNNFEILKVISIIFPKNITFKFYGEECIN